MKFAASFKRMLLSYTSCTGPYRIFTPVLIQRVHRISLFFVVSAVTMPTRGAQSAAKFDLGHLLRIQHSCDTQKLNMLADPHIFYVICKFEWCRMLKRSAAEPSFHSCCPSDPIAAGARLSIFRGSLGGFSSEETFLELWL